MFYLLGDTTGNSNIKKQIAIYNYKIYVGGFFTSIGGQNRNSLAALDLTTGMATAWNPNVGNDIEFNVTFWGKIPRL